MSAHGVSTLRYAHYQYQPSLCWVYEHRETCNTLQQIIEMKLRDGVRVCVYGVFWWWIQSLLKLAFVCSLQGSLICPGAIPNPKAVARSGESPLACTCFPSDRTVAYGGCTYCATLFELEYLQFSLPLHPSLFCHRSQTVTLILKPECPSVKIFTGRIVHNVFMHNENACEGYYSIGNKTETAQRYV